MRSHDAYFDVAATTGLAEARLAGTLHLPDAIMPGSRLDLLLCLHGGGCRRSYWHAPFGSNDDYSFARFFADRGTAVLALDLLGMGDSSKPEPESRLSRAIIAAANAQALAETVRALTDGTHAQARAISVTGVGHSIGGMVIITQAAACGGLDRLAVLGWANQPLKLGDTEVSELAATLVPSGYLPAPRQLLRSLFYLPDVPAAVVEADEALATATPACLGRDALTPGIVHAAAAQIRVPVVTMFGEVDTSPDPWGEPAYFKGSADVTLTVIQGSAHCHNVASARRTHWERLHRWIDSFAP